MAQAKYTLYNFTLRIDFGNVFCGFVLRIDKYKAEKQGAKETHWVGSHNPIHSTTDWGASLADHNERRNSRLFELRARSHNGLFRRLGVLLNIEWRAPQDRTPSNAQKIGARP